MPILILLAAASDGTQASKDTPTAVSTIGDVAPASAGSPALRASGALAASAGAKFSRDFRLEDCEFETVGDNPFFPLKPGLTTVLEGVVDGERTRLEITVLRRTIDIGGVRARVVEEREHVDGKLFLDRAEILDLHASVSTPFRHFGKAPGSATRGLRDPGSVASVQATRRLHMKTATMDRIEKTTVLRAPRSRVWRALTDPEAFGEWFRVKVDGTFTPGARVRGKVTYPGWEHIPFDITIEEMEPERRFSWRWHPHMDETGRDYSDEPATLVVFELAEVPEGTRLTVVESGFDRIPADRLQKAYRGNESGWAGQLKNIERYVSSAW